jgi:ceramide glucosyltransferase
MIFIFYFFAAVLVWLSFKSFLGGIRYLKYFRERLGQPLAPYEPYVTVIAPCKGLDEGLEENLAAVLDQKYTAFEVIFVVDDELDPALEAIRHMTAGRSVPTKTVVARRSLESGQKVENLREAVLHASAASQVFVFVDSDARPSPGWLASLVSPLVEETVGVGTGYRWFVSSDRDLASEMASVWNASIASALGPNSAFCWGGSTAIRRQTFEKLDIREKWRGSVSDDFVLADIVKNAGLDIVFVPRALTASFQRMGMRSLLEFTNRQMKLTRVYAPKLWLMTLIGTGLFNAVLIAALLIVVFSHKNDLPVWISIGAIALVTLFSVGKSWTRLAAVRLALPQYGTQVKQQFWPQNTLWLVTGALFFVNCLAALFSRRITWRGIDYELKSPTETVIISGK